MVTGQGTTTTTLGETGVAVVVERALAPLALDGKRVLVIIPDGTRTAPIPQMYRLLQEQLGPWVAHLDFLIALGTHKPMGEAAIDRLVGLPTAERVARHPNSAVLNHRWELPESFVTIGTIPEAETAELTGGLLAADVPVARNRLIFDYDQLIICGPVFPHEVAGFSGGAKYLFPGIAGAQIINFTHWLGALMTSVDTIGVKDTPVRRVIHRAAHLVERPILLLAMVLKGRDFHGLYAAPSRRPGAPPPTCRRSSTSPTGRGPSAGYSRWPRRSTRISGRRPRRCTKPSRWWRTAARRSSMRPTSPRFPHPRHPDRSGWVPRPRLLHEAVGALQGPTGWHPRP